MCGIIGAFGEGAYKCDLAQQLLKLKVRGPDSQIIRQPHPFLVMGAARLAMTDPHPRSNQPFSKNGNWIVFNGEIYNYEFLREYLTEKYRIKFTTYSDTEVLLELLQIYGPKAIEMLNGMYAFAFYDAAKQKLFLARDNLGKKPLYFARYSNNLLWSSSIETLVAFTTSKEINNSALIEYLAFGYTIDTNTIYDGITAVRPGTMHEFDINLVEAISSSQKFDNKYAKRCVGIRDAIDTAVEERVNLHSNVAISLSGGLDSAIVTLLAKRRDIDVTAYSLKWTDSDKERYNKDSDVAKEVASNLGVNFFAVDFSARNDLERHLKSFIKVMGEPNSNPTGVSMIPLYSQVEQNNHRLILTGDGADEIFGGYPRYESFLLGDSFRFLSSRKTWQLSGNGKFLKKFALRLGSLDNPALWANFHWNFQPREISILLSGKRRPKGHELSQALFSSMQQLRIEKHQVEFKKAVQSVMELDSKIWLTNESNRKLDRVSMGFSIEARSPFQDSRVIEIAKNAIQGNRRFISNKAILREAFPEAEHLGVRQDKAGFISPVGHWLRTNPNIVKTGLDAVNESGLFNSYEVTRRNKDQFSGDFTKIRQLWSLVVLGYWFLHSWEK